MPANKLHEWQVKYDDSKGQCIAFELKSHPAVGHRAEELNMISN